ncbi:MAG: hypothetical protein ABRQ39_22410 [Candidatus Eremiobacterota bacterium]
MKPFKALSLVESLITLMILSLLSGILIWMILLAKTSMESSKNRTYLRQDMQIVTTGMVRELQDSRKKSLAVINQGIKSFSFISARNASGKFVTDTSGAPVWQNVDGTWRFVIYYIPANTTNLMRKEISKSTDNALSSSELLSFCDGKGEKLSSMVNDMSLTVPVAEKDKYADISITFQSKSRAGKTDRMTFQSRIFISN